MWNITLLWLFYRPVLSWLYFFLGLAPRSHPWTDFNRLWPKWRVVTQGCAFWEFEWPPTILRGSKTPKNPKKGAWLGIFQPMWQNYKIVISIPNFDTVIEPHSWLREWSRITKFYSRWRTAAILQNIGNAITRLPMDRFGWNLGGRIPSCPRYVRHVAVAIATAVA